uniref:Uncharacterized protein n=1 Tax=Alexandrium catenella TaxID=2925 RepID=A0A7S1PWG9_ALECA
MPTCCDSLRLTAKRRWLAGQQQKENEAANAYRNKRAAQIAAVITAEEAQADILEVADDLDAPALKRQRRGEDDPEALPLWEAISRAADFQAYAKDAGFVVDMAWQLSGGTLARQLIRLVDACVREKRVAMMWAVGRACLRAANEGPLSSRTRLATETACDLAKAKRINLRALEMIISDLAKSVRDHPEEGALAGACGAVAWVLVHMFPQKTDVGWGWLHQTWSWNNWWDFVARCLQDFKPLHAYQVLRTTLELMVAQAGTGSVVRELPTWVGDPLRVKELRRRLCKTSGLTGPELLQELDHLGIDDKREEPAQEQP